MLAPGLVSSRTDEYDKDEPCEASIYDLNSLIISFDEI
jgi:hypothetical protein